MRAGVHPSRRLVVGLIEVADQRDVGVQAVPLRGGHEHYALLDHLPERKRMPVRPDARIGRREQHVRRQPARPQLVADPAGDLVLAHAGGNAIRHRCKRGGRVAPHGA